MLKNKDVIIVVEGARGVGTTSFGNYLRFNAQKTKRYFTPTNEIRIEPNWLLETLLAAIISNIVRELELNITGNVLKDKRFIEAKALSKRISEVYKSFGLSAFSVGASYGENVGISQPTIVPAPVIGHHLEDLAKLITDLGYKNGILIQLNNLDLGAIHTEAHLKYTLNSLRDYMQTRNVSWLLVGDTGIRSFIASKVDRVDDIIGHEAFINPLSKKDYQLLIERRMNFYKKNKNAAFPVTKEVFEYLYDVTEGRLRYVFGLLSRMVSRLCIGNLINTITIDIAKPLITELAKSRIKTNDLTDAEEVVLKALVKLKKSSVKGLIKASGKNRVFVSRALGKFLKLELVSSVKKGTLHIYEPSLDAKIAYN
ncbi:MAG: hypothetical protein M1561_04565 [Gammaproteobacteria bacterium]|nr:hypothetical protein [Gammaproteobacteria bacterium]